LSAEPFRLPRQNPRAKTNVLQPIPQALSLSSLVARLARSCTSSTVLREWRGERPQETAPRSPTNVRHYVLAGNRASGLDANSQFEALAQNTCKKKSGDSMSCISCHNPHYYPSADERASYYRGKCLACYGAAFGTKHQPKKVRLYGLPHAVLSEHGYRSHRGDRSPHSAPSRVVVAVKDI